MGERPLAWVTSEKAELRVESAANGQRHAAERASWRPDRLAADGPRRSHGGAGAFAPEEPPMKTHDEPRRPRSRHPSLAPGGARLLITMRCCADSPPAPDRRPKTLTVAHPCPVRREAHNRKPASPEASEPTAKHCRRWLARPPSCAQSSGSGLSLHQSHAQRRGRLTAPALPRSDPGTPP
eukprot:scaffold9569_cov142-Isochrysis_galbana.AAC.7